MEAEMMEKVIVDCGEFELTAVNVNAAFNIQLAESGDDNKR